MIDGLIKIARNTQPWNGFTLQRGHVFGQYKGVLYISAWEAAARKGYVYVYRRWNTPDHYHWEKVSIPVCSDVGRLLYQAIQASPYRGVTFQRTHVNTQRWTPTFPTFRSRRPTEKPPLVKPQAVRTYVDQIIGRTV